MNNHWIEIYSAIKLDPDLRFPVFPSDSNGRGLHDYSIKLITEGPLTGKYQIQSSRAGLKALKGLVGWTKYSA